MNPAPRPPFFLISEIWPDGIAVLDAIGDLPGSIESNEVEDGRYRLYDAEGRRGNLRLRNFDVEVGDWAGPDPEAFRKQLEKAVMAIGMAEETLPDSLEELVRRAVPRIRDHRRRLARGQWPNPLRWFKKAARHS